MLAGLLAMTGLRAFVPQRPSLHFHTIPKKSHWYVSALLHNVSFAVYIACVDRPGNATIFSDWLWKTDTTVQR